MRLAAFLSFLLASQGSLLLGQSTTPLIAIKGDIGLLLPPGAQATLNVVVTDRSGNALANQPVLFVAPATGSTGTFLNAASADGSFFRVMTDGAGAATATFVANATPGVYLVEAMVEGTAASVTFAITSVTSDGTQPPLTAADVRAAVEQKLLFGTQLDETFSVHGPVLAPAGGTVTAAFPPSASIAAQPYTTDRQSWVLWIDEQPGFRFGHRVRFVIVDAADTTADLSKARITREQSWPVVRLSADGAPNPLLPPSGLNDRPFLKASKQQPPQLRSIHPAGILAFTPGACAILVHGVVDGGAQDVVDMQNFLVNSGRVSGGNSLTQASANGRNAPATRKELAALIQLAADLQCKKVYLYISSHGTESGSVVLVNGDTGESDPVYADELQKMLAPLAGVEICPIIDACYSGKMAPAFQGIGSTGNFVSASDASHTAKGGSDHFTPALIKCWMDPKASTTGDGMVTLDDAKKWVDQNASQDVTGCKPLSLPINPKNKVVSIPDVNIDKAGGQGTIVIPRPAGIPLDSRINGTLFLPDTKTAKLGRFGEKGFEVDLLPGEASTTVLVTGVRDGQVHAFFDGVDTTTGLSVTGSVLISVGGPYAAVNVPLLIPPNSTKSIQLYRFEGYEQTLRQAILQVNSQDPGIAVPFPDTLTFSPYQAYADLTIKAMAPGHTSFSARDDLANIIFNVPGFDVGVPEIIQIEPKLSISVETRIYTVSGSNLGSVTSGLIKTDTATTQVPAHDVTPNSFQFNYRFMIPGPIDFSALTGDGLTSNTLRVSVQPPPPPVINKVDPSTFPASILKRIFRVTGTGFQQGDRVFLVVADLATQGEEITGIVVEDSEKLIVNAYVPKPGKYLLSVVDLFGQQSNKFPLTVTDAVPAIISIDPSTPSVAGGFQIVTVSGTDFPTVITLGVAAPDGSGTGISGLQIQHVSPTRFDAFIQFNLAGLWGIQIITPSVISNIFNFTVLGAIQGPLITSINPASFTAGSSPVVITINGSNIDSSASVVLVPPGGSPVTFSGSQVQHLGPNAVQIVFAFNMAGNGSITVFNGNRSSNAFAFSVAPTGPTNPLTLACSANPGQVNVAYMSSLMATGGVPPYSFAVVSGSLPQGLMLNAWTGAITGTPGTAGNSTFTVQVTDSTGTPAGTVKQNCGINVTPAALPAPVINQILPPNLTTNTAPQQVFVQGNYFVPGNTTAFLGFPGGGGQTFQGQQIQNSTTTSFTLLAPLTTPGNYTLAVTAGGKMSPVFVFVVK